MWFTQCPYEGGIVTMLILQIRKLRHRSKVVLPLVTQWSQDLNIEICLILSNDCIVWCSIYVL